MAQIVLGIGTSHTPQMSSGPEYWEGHAKRDQHNEFLIGTDGEVHSYSDLIAKTDISKLASELTLDVWQHKFNRAQDAVDTLSKELNKANPDVIIVVGDDHDELFGPEGRPTFGLCTGKELWDRGLTPERIAEIPDDIRPAQWAYHSSNPEKYILDDSFTYHIAQRLIFHGVDIGTFSVQGTTKTLGHAFTFIRRRLRMLQTPIIPIAVNTYYPPNVPTANRCWQVGEAIRIAINEWDATTKVAIVASGGLSHFVVNEVLDRSVLEGLSAKKSEILTNIPQSVLRSGNSEILNWIIVGSCLQDFKFEVVDYINGYRSPAGTGMGMGFAIWA